MRDTQLKRLAQVEDIAKKYGWMNLDHQANIFMISFSKEGTRINVYYSKVGMTIATILKHPNQVRNSLYRRYVTLEELGKILEDPRIHTGKGYR